MQHMVADQEIQDQGQYGEGLRPALVRLLPSAEKRSRDVGKKLDRLAARQSWYTFMAGQAYAVATGKAPAKRNAEIPGQPPETGLNVDMTPNEFITKWQASELKERSASQEHFIDLCRLLGEPTPADADPTGETYCFERGARRDAGGDGWADVWKRHHFAWEYKGRRANLDAAFNQLRQYALALENPPLLIVSDMVRFRIRTNWTNSVSRTHEFKLNDLADAATREQAEVGVLRARTSAARRNPAGADRAGGGVVRVRRSGAARARSRCAGGRPLRQPPGLLHVRRRRRSAAGPHVHADAAACAACPGSIRRAGRRTLPGDGVRRPRRLRDGGLVQRQPQRPLPRDELAAKALKKRTLTSLYNDRPRWLADAHAALDAAVAAAYGWPADITDEEAVRELLQLNTRT